MEFRPEKKLGFGLMRLPKLEDGSIDVEQTKDMVDLFLENGFTYFDTAFVYEGSEDAIRQALVERYPRESYTLATKMNGWLGCDDEASCKAQFDTSLQRTGAGYFDYYLLHALQENTYQKYDEYHVWDYVKQLKEEGKVKHYGFSFHAKPELLEELLTLHPDVDFVQLQINYADWEDENVQSRRNYEVCVKHGKPVVVMEPIKGGSLANPLPQIAEMFKGYNPDDSAASWAIRFVASLENVMVVLSGMSTLDQMKDNVSYMKDFKPLNEEEQEIIVKARKILDEVEIVPCTACHYCTEGCPMGIPIPEIFSCLNAVLQYNDMAAGKRRYERVTADKAKAGDCIQCGQCEGACPQRINVIERLQKASELFD
ncbi:MAG: aldo/keto reductase [Erysipelotrichaceae bacterium]|nr:aldo/keto reductase [Erysipelotrichaceae bacterium]